MNPQYLFSAYFSWLLALVAAYLLTPDTEDKTPTKFGLLVLIMTTLICGTVIFSDLIRHTK